MTKLEIAVWATLMAAVIFAGALAHARQPIGQVRCAGSACAIVMYPAAATGRVKVGSAHGPSKPAHK